MRFSPVNWIIIGLAFFSFSASALISDRVFERLPHLEDEVAYLFQARVFASGELMARSVAPSGAFWQPFVIDHSSGTRFSKYPPGWSAWLALGVAMGAPWWVNAAFALLTVALTYRLAREVFGREVGVAAALLLAISPMALLLNATLMAHSAALFFSVGFLYGYWRLTQPGVAWRWGLIAGLALGMVVIIRPLTAVGVATPLIAWSGLRLARSLFNRPAPLRGVFLRATLTPLLALSAGALALSTVIPGYSALATGNPWQNLYTLVPGWQYDRIGFGEDIGRSGHTLQKGIQHMRYDLSLTAADLFGWQWGTFPPEAPNQYDTRATDAQCNDPNDPTITPQQHLRTCSGYWRYTGLSWLLLIPALLLGWRRPWAAGWLAYGAVWIALLPEAFFSQPELWALAGIAWVFAPLAFLYPHMDTDPRANWTWLLFGVIAGVVAVHVAYWVGSQRYSTRYYYEALSAAAILSALPIGYAYRWLKGRRALRAALVALVVGLCLWSLTQYSAPRIRALTGFNHITRGFVEAVEARRVGDAPLLVLVTSDSARRWRSHGALMAVSQPDHSGDLVVAWYDAGRDDIRRAIEARFPSHQVVELLARGDAAWFPDTCTPAGCPILNDPAGGMIQP